VPTNKTNHHTPILQPPQLCSGSARASRAVFRALAENARAPQPIKRSVQRRTDHDRLRASPSPTQSNALAAPSPIAAWLAAPNRSEGGSSLVKASQDKIFQPTPQNPENKPVTTNSKKTNVPDSITWYIKPVPTNKTNRPAARVQLTVAATSDKFIQC